MTAVQPRRDAESKRFIWVTVTMLILFGIASYVVTSVPPAQAEEQTLSTTPSPQSDYGRPVTIAGGTLHSEQSAGMNGERRTVVTYEVSGDPDDANTFGPHLVARVIHDSGAVMVCKMGESERLRSEPGTYYLGCDRLVDLDKVEQWSAAELISCERIEVFEELFRDHPCGVE